MSAHGEGSIQAEPDHAVLRLAVNRVDISPKASLEDAKNAVSAVRTALRAHGIADALITSSRVLVHSDWDEVRGKRSLVGHRSRVEFSVRVSRLDQVEAAIVDAVEAGADEIVEVVYGTSRAAELLSEAREQAVAAAHRKARLYAEVTNVRLGPVVHIEDLDPAQGGVGHMGGWLAGGDGAAAGMAPAGTADLAPGRVMVQAAVVLGFSIAR